jgi:hypothetical protein
MAVDDIVHHIRTRPIIMNDNEKVNFLFITGQTIFGTYFRFGLSPVIVTPFQLELQE